MMGGLAYMTGRPGDPLRAGTSASTTSWAACSARSACWARCASAASPAGAWKCSRALFENNVFLVGQHMLQFAMTGKHRGADAGARRPVGVYDVFTVKDGEQIFLAAVSDTQWITFCDALGFDDLKADPALATNNERVAARPALLSRLGERLQRLSAAELSRAFEGPACRSRRSCRPEAAARRPAPAAPPAAWPTSRCTDGERAGADGEDHAVPAHAGRPAPGRAPEPPRVGEHTREVLAALGYRGTRDRRADRSTRSGLNQRHPRSTRRQHR